MIDLIHRVYNTNHHIDSTKPNAISTTTLIGPKYKAKLYINKEPKDPTWIDNKFKRSSTLGTAFHEYAERELSNDTDFVIERFLEREVTVDGTTYTISGACDGLRRTGDDEWTIFDWKTGYGKEFKNTDQARKQLSIYRWLFNEEYNIVDEGYVLFISMSNNSEFAYTIDLMSMEQTQEFIEANLYSIIHNEKVDCNDGVKFNMCTYCEYSCLHRQ